MRTKDVLLDNFEDVKTLCQYLYMSEEHKVVIRNNIGVPLEIYMTEECEIMCQNLNFPDTPPFNWESQSSPRTLMSIIEVLKKEPAVELPNSFKNRWEEVKNITAANVAQNHMDRRK